MNKLEENKTESNSNNNNEIAPRSNMSQEEILLEILQNVRSIDNKLDRLVEVLHLLRGIDKMIENLSRQRVNEIKESEGLPDLWDRY